MSRLGCQSTAISRWSWIVSGTVTPRFPVNDFRSACFLPRPCTFPIYVPLCQTVKTYNIPAGPSIFIPCRKLIDPYLLLVTVLFLAQLSHFELSEFMFELLYHLFFEIVALSSSKESLSNSPYDHFKSGIWRLSWNVTRRRSVVGTVM